MSYITYNIVTENAWDQIQDRTLDPYSLLKSDSLNKLNSIYGDNIILKGFDLTTLQSDKLKLVLKSGTAIKDSVLININSDITMYLDNTDPDFLTNFSENSGLIVLTYQYDKVVPAPIAKIEFIKEEEYDPEKHLGLHRLIFDSNGKIDTLTRMIQPKDNIVYEEMLTEVNSVAISAVKNVLSELGNEGIAELIQIYMRLKGTSIGGDYTSITKYYKLISIPKYNYKNLLNIVTAVKHNTDHFYNKYTIGETVFDLDVKTESITTGNSSKEFANYANVLIYDDSDNYNIYLALNGEITGNVEVYESVYNSDEVVVYNISESKEPDLTKEILTWNAKTSNKVVSNTYVNDILIWNESNMGSGSGLDSDKLDGHDSLYFASQQDIAALENRINESIATLVKTLNEIGTIASNAIPLTQKGVANGVATLNEDGVVPSEQLDVKVVDGVIFHADAVDPVGTSRLNCEGNFYATKIFNATFKDVAECFESEDELNFSNCKNRIMALDYRTGKARLSRRNDRMLLGVVSDTYGILLGGNQEQLDSNENIVPIAMCGTVWVELSEMDGNRMNFGYGNLVGPDTQGYGRIVTRDDPYVGMIVDWNEDSTLVKILVKLNW